MFVLHLNVLLIYLGTGSILQQSGDLDAAYAQAEMAGNQSELVLQELRKLKLRLFTANEISALLGNFITLFGKPVWRVK